MGIRIAADEIITPPVAARGWLAGHGLTYRNIDPIARIEEIEELNIGHSIIARAAIVGIERAVREMIELMRHPRH